jgi:RNase H-fold protein (predicted Holliday junction resolvase)
MICETLTNKRVLAIDPAIGGMGIAIMEGPERLIDWGVKSVKDNHVPRYLKKIDYLIEQYQPDIIITENPTGKGSRRCKRVQHLIEKITDYAAKKKIKVRRFSRGDVRRAFSEYNAFTKHEIATAIAKQLPELELQLPPFRKSFMVEDYRMSIFDSVAFALTYYHNENHAS